MELLVAHTNLATDLSCSTFSAVVFLALKKSFIFDCKPDDGWSVEKKKKNETNSYKDIKLK